MGSTLRVCKSFLCLRSPAMMLGLMRARFRIVQDRAARGGAFSPHHLLSLPLFLRDENKRLRALCTPLDTQV